MMNGALLIHPITQEEYIELLESEIMTLRSRLIRADEEKEQLQADLEKWRRIVAEIICGRKTEVLRTLTDGAVQMGWNLDAPGQPITANPQTASEAAPESGKTPRKRSRTKKDRLAKLVRRIEEGEITPDEVIPLEAPPKNCPHCGSAMGIMTHEKRYEVVTTPPQITIREIRVPVQKCDDCTRNEITVPIYRPEDLFVRPLPGCMASAETLAALFYNKNGLALPLYRLEHAFSDIGLPVSRQTLSNWYLAAAKAWLQPICDVLHLELCTADLIQADETSFHVLKKGDGRSGSASGFTWVYMAPGGSNAHRPVRVRSCPEGRVSPEISGWFFRLPPGRRLHGVPNA